MIVDNNAFELPNIIQTKPEIDHHKIEFIITIRINYNYYPSIELYAKLIKLSFHYYSNFFFISIYLLTLLNSLANEMYWLPFIFHISKTISSHFVILLELHLIIFWILELL